MNRSVNILASVMALMAWTGSAQAQLERSCVPHADLAEQLAEKYGEQVRVMGLTLTGYLMEIWASPDTGTWTLVSTRPTGISCVIGAGEHFEVIRQVAEGRKS